MLSEVVKPEQRSCQIPGRGVQISWDWKPHSHRCCRWVWEYAYDWIIWSLEPYSITCITTMQSGVMTQDGKKKLTSKCYCSLCDYMVQNHPSVNNHFCAHLRLSLLCTINGCFHIEHGCNDMWLHIGRQDSIPSAHAAVPPLRKSKKLKK